MQEINMYPWERNLVNDLRESNFTKKIIWYKISDNYDHTHGFYDYLKEEFNIVISEVCTNFNFHEYNGEPVILFKPGISEHYPKLNSLLQGKHEEVNKQKNKQKNKQTTQTNQTIRFNPPLIILFTNKLPLYDKIDINCIEVRNI